MVENYVGRIGFHNTTPWLAYASWTWEILRRNPEYISYYNALKNKGLETRLDMGSASLLVASKAYPTANKFGLLVPADPSKYAGEERVFWHPDALQSVVRFHVIDKADIDRSNKPIQLSKMPGDKTHFLDAHGTYHIRILGERFWFQMQCDNVDYVAPESYIGLEINNLENPEKRLATFKQIGGVYDGSIDLSSRLHVPPRLESHIKATLAYDIRTAGGSILDVVSAFKEAGLIVEDPEKYVDYRDIAKNAYRAGKAHVYGDYLKILSRQ